MKYQELSGSKGYLRECLYDVEWQKLRVSLLAKHNEPGGFSTIKGVENNLDRLFNYSMKQAPYISPEELARRVWRITNLLAATLFGYGEKEQFKEHADLVRTALRGYSSKHEKLKHLLDNGLWDWDIVARDLRNLHVGDHETFIAIMSNLKGRIRTAKYKERKGTGGLSHRSELVKFMHMMEDLEAGY